jgi:hypothetical protein
LPGQAYAWSRSAAPRLSRFARRLGQEVRGQQRHVAAALAQRRQRERDAVQPVVEVLPEAALGALRPQVLVGRRHHADVDLDRTRAAHPEELARLDRAQELRLHGSDTSPISSRNSTPRSAASNRPGGARARP